MKKLTFTVTLEFADKITGDEEISEVAINIAEALKHEAISHGLAPENSDTYTESIDVFNSVVNTNIHIEI